MSDKKYIINGTILDKPLEYQTTKGKWSSAAHMMVQADYGDMEMRVIAHGFPKEEEDDWGRDGDISMPNGPHGDEEPPKAKGFITIKTDDKTTEALDSLRYHLKEMLNPKCQCGVDSVHGPQSNARMHSDWCPKHNVFRTPIIMGDDISKL